MKTLTKDDVEKLSRGKSTKSKSGSRAVPHRLTKDEREEFERAKKRGVLKPKRWHRENLINIWEKWQDTTK